MVYGYFKFYESRFRNRTYFIGKGVDNILIRKSAKKIYELSNKTIKDNIVKDLYSPLILMEYKNKKLSVEADSEKEAIDIAADEYAELGEDYEVNPDDFVDAEFEIVKG